RRHRLRPWAQDVDAQLSERLSRVDDRDRARVPREPARLADGQHVAGLAGDERNDDCPRTVAHSAAHLLEKAVRVAVPSELAQLVAELGAPAQRIERAPVLLESGDDQRSRRDRETRDKRVQAIAPRLRARDTGCTPWIAERRGEIRTGRIQSRVLGRVAELSEHADLVEPGAAPLRGAPSARDRRGGAR